MYSAHQYREVQTMHKKGFNMVSISKVLGIKYDVVRGWLTRGHAPICISEKFKNRDMRKPHLIQRTQLKADYNNLTESKAYILGVLCGDASLNKRSIELNTIDGDFALEFATAMYKHYGIKSSMSIRGEKLLYSKQYQKFYMCQAQARCIASSINVIEDITRYGLFKAEVWRIPVEITVVNNIIKSAFLRGWFDSEGSYYKGNITAVSVNLVGLQQIQRLICDVGIHSQLTTQTDKYYKKAYHRLFITGHTNLQRFADVIGFSIRRKQNQLIQRINTMQHQKRHTEVSYKIAMWLHKHDVHYTDIAKLLQINSYVVWCWIHHRTVAREMATKERFGER